MNARVITLINQKGGVGKTTTALALGAGLALRGYRTLFVDLDAQGNLTYVLGADGSGLAGKNVFDVLMGNAAADAAVQQTPLGSVLASAPALAGADLVLSAVGKEHRLREALEAVQGQYDYIVVDTPPALGVLTINALTACTGIIITAQADVFSMQGIAQLYDTLPTVKKYCNPSLRVLGILLTRYSARAILSRDLADKMGDVAERLQTKVYATKIRETIAIKEAQSKRQSLYDYAPKSNAALDYLAFVDEFLAEEAISYGY